MTVQNRQPVENKANGMLTLASITTTQQVRHCDDNYRSQLITGLGDQTRLPGEACGGQGAGLHILACAAKQSANSCELCEKKKSHAEMFIKTTPA